MNFHSHEKQIFKSFAVLKFATTENEPKQTKMMDCELRTSNSDSRPIFPLHVHNQTGFGNPFINGRGFIYLGELRR